MTIEEIRTSDKTMLTAADVAEVLGVDQQGIRIMAHEQPDKLGFPIMVTGRKGRSVRIPRVPFLRFLGADS